MQTEGFCGGGGPRLGRVRRVVCIGEWLILTFGADGRDIVFYARDLLLDVHDVVGWWYIGVTIVNVGTSSNIVDLEFSQYCRSLTLAIIWDVVSELNRADFRCCGVDPS